MRPLGAFMAFMNMGPTLHARTVTAVPLPAQSVRVEQCRPARTRNADSLLTRSIAALGLASARGMVRIGDATDIVSMDFQSDRMYPPYLRRTATQRVLSDWEMATQALESGTAPNLIRSVSTARMNAIILPRGAAPIVSSPKSGSGYTERALDPWMVLADWRAAKDVRVTNECFYRDYWRVVLTRGDGNDEERLFVDPRTLFPTKLDRMESRALWGDGRVEYLWSIWKPVGVSNAMAPEFIFRQIDGETNQERRVARYTFVPRDSIAPIVIPDGLTPPVTPPAAPSPDTIRVSANTFVLRTPAYSNVVTLQRDTVFVLDAQSSAARAQQDSVWIGKLFPGRHPIVLVVTDLAWPHISGVRYWVALGVPVYSHTMSKEFLTRVVDHKWTMDPDLLETRRPRAHLRFVAVDSAASLGGGGVQLRPIDGAGSEGALMAFVPADKFLYAGDYIQNSSAPGSFTALYAREVEAAVVRNRMTPERFAAMHVQLTPWADISRFTGRPPVQ